MKYCIKCVLPDTRPNIRFDENGTCNACANASLKAEINWADREQAFRNVVENARSKNRGYDCLIPVSGGKDSTWQVVKCLEYGLNPLTMTWRPPGRTEIGQRNLQNLINLGVDHIDYQINPEVEKTFMYRALVDYGATAVPMHMAMFNIPVSLAIRFQIPLIVWGENSAFEYGSANEADEGFKLDSDWFKKYGVTHGTTAKDWVGKDLTKSELTPYFSPSDQEIEQAGLLAVFLGYYFPWDPETSLAVAQQHGFQTREAGPKTGYWDYADIDDDFISIHHYLKWYKFGMTRVFDNLSVDIRCGRLAREQAVQIIRELEDQTPYEDIAKFCDFVNITGEHFFDVIEKFRNPKIWVRTDGTWQIDGFLISDWNWSCDSRPPSRRVNLTSAKDTVSQ